MGTGPNREAIHTSVHLWRVDLNVEADAEESFYGQLSPSDLTRAKRFTSPVSRRRYIVTRGTLRMLLGSFLGELPRSIPIEAEPAGKPHVLGMRGIHFNVSHSAEMAMICIATCGDVGVDLESVRDVPAAAALARRHFTPLEANFVEEGGAAGAAGRFLLCWTRKEALVKALGTGLNLDLRDFVVPLTSSGAILAIDECEGGPAKRWLLLDVPLGDEYVAALALPASVMDRSVVPSPGLARARYDCPMDHCKEIDVPPLISSVMSSSVP
jgi:4'-phosphopantetheinyl transferase